MLDWRCKAQLHDNTQTAILRASLITGTTKGDKVSCGMRSRAGRGASRAAGVREWGRGREPTILRASLITGTTKGDKVSCGMRSRAGRGASRAAGVREWGRGREPKRKQGERYQKQAACLAGTINTSEQVSRRAYKSFCLVQQTSAAAILMYSHKDDR